MSYNEHESEDALEQALAMGQNLALKQMLQVNETGVRGKPAKTITKEEYLRMRAQEEAANPQSVGGDSRLDRLEVGLNEMRDLVGQLVTGLAKQASTPATQTGPQMGPAPQTSAPSFPDSPTPRKSSESSSAGIEVDEPDYVELGDLEEEADSETEADLKREADLERSVSTVAALLKGAAPFHRFRRFMGLLVPSKLFGFEEWPPLVQRRFNEEFVRLLADRDFIKGRIQSVRTFQRGHGAGPEKIADFIVILAGACSLLLAMRD